MACHGPNGAGIPAQYPCSGGQHAGYIVAQMTAFRSGERANNTVMRDIALKMTDAQIKAVASISPACADPGRNFFRRRFVQAALVYSPAAGCPANGPRALSARGPLAVRPRAPCDTAGRRLTAI